MLTRRVRHAPRSDGQMSSGRLRAVVVMVLAAALLGGCGVLTDLASLSSRLEEAGYSHIQANHNVVNGRTVLSISALVPGPATPGDEERILRIVWETYPRKFDELRLVLNGRTVDVASRDDLVDLFGERDPALEQGTGLGRVLLIAVLVFLTVVVLTLVLVLLLVRRRRRRRRNRVADPPYPPVPGGGYPQAPRSAPWPHAAPPGQPYGAPSGQPPGPYGPPAGQRSYPSAGQPPSPYAPPPTGHQPPGSREQ